MAGGSQGKHEVGVNGREYAQRAAPELHAGKEEVCQSPSFHLLGRWRHLRLKSFDQAATM